MALESEFSFLEQVISEAEARRQAEEDARKAREKLLAEGRALYSLGTEILQTRGTLQKTSIAVGSGKGRGEGIGMRLEPASFLKTPPVPIVIDGKQGSITLENNPGKNIVPVIHLQVEIGGMNYRIFTVDKVGRTRNHLGEEDNVIISVRRVFELFKSLPLARANSGGGMKKPYQVIL